MEIYNNTISKDKIVASPVDTVLDGVITKIEKGKLSEFIDPKVHGSFDNLDQETLRIQFEVKFSDKVIKGNDRLAFYDEPMSNSKLAKFLTKYEELKSGVQIKVIYDSNGFGKIVV